MCLRLITVMKLILYLWLIVSFNFKTRFVATTTASWDKLISSTAYKNTKIVAESTTPLQSLTFRKETSVMTTTMACSKFCTNSKQCLSFNVYSTNDNHVCEFLSENFCNKTKRIALQVWPESTVWDKLLPGMTQACIDQQLAPTTGNAACEIGRSGCRSSTSLGNDLSACNTCVQTCKDCQIFYNKATDENHKCILWPDGSAQTPIFTFCIGPTLIIAKRQVALSDGQIGPNYRMTVQDMHRISRLNVYSSLIFVFKAGGTNYTATYENFVIDATGALMNMVYVASTDGDGFNLGGKALQSSPWIETESSCGSFWYLNTALNSATLQCPGGDVNFFGSVNINVSPKQTGIRWPVATAAGAERENVSGNNAMVATIRPKWFWSTNNALIFVFLCR